MLILQVMAFITIGALAITFALDIANVWIVAFAIAILGCFWAADFSTRRALIAEVTDPTLTPRAMSLETVSHFGSKFAATIIAGGLLALGGATLAYAALALLHLSVVISVISLRRLIAATEQMPEATMPIFVLIRSGITTALQVPQIRAVLLITVCMNMLVFPYMQLIAVVAEEILSVGPQRMGILASMDGLGASLAATLLAFRLRPSRAGLFFASGAILGGSMVVALALSTFYPLSLGIQIVAGACFGAFSSMQPALILNAVEPQLRARAMGMLAMAIGVAPFGLLISGGLSSLIGASLSIAAMAAIAVVLMFTIVFRYRVLVQT
jgi:hypothetical protein